MNRDEIISALGTNKNLLTDAVRAVAGNSPMEYMRMLKLDEARKMLDHHPELTIEAIAFSCGFNIPSTFYRLFRKQYPCFFCAHMPQKCLRRVCCNIIGTKCNKVGTKCNSVSSVNRFFCSMISKEQER